MRLLLKSVSCLFVLIVLSFVSTVFGQYRPPSTGRVEYTAAPKKVIARRISGTLQAASGKAVLLMVTDPGNSHVYVDGMAKGESDNDGNFKIELPIGKDYKVEVKRDKYVAYTQQIKVDSAEARLLQANLAATFGGIKIIGDTPEDARSLATAKILLDDKPATVSFDEANRQATIADVPTGEHKITILHPNYVVWDKDLEVVGGYEMTLAPKLVAAAKLNIHTVPGVDVLIDKVKQGSTSASGDLAISTPLQPGEHQVELQKAGFVSDKRTINLAASDKNSLSVEEMEPTPSFTELVDYFNDGLTYWNAPSGWKWDSTKKEVTISDTGKKGPNGGPELGLAKGRSFRDFEFVFDVKFVNGVGAAWIVRAHTPETYYLFELSVKDQKLRSFLVDHGQRKALNTSNVLVPLNNTASFRVRADIQGNRIRHYIKNNETADEELMGLDVEGTLRYGTVGFTALDGQTFAIKDAFVRPYQDSAVSVTQQ